MLGIAAARLTPSELIRAVLACDADLLWLGGIGTYVRGDHETDAEAGDRANDGLRIPARELRVKVIGEGANLGLTQRARIDAARRGVRLNTDFIDNSAGVNSSDQEVNIKIALAPALADGRLDRARRNALLSSMTEDVAAACLANTYAQSLAISLECASGAAGLGAAMQLMHTLQSRGLLDRALQVLPDDAALRQRRAAAGPGLTRPEIAVLLSHAKLALSHDLIASRSPDDPAVAGTLSAYFPPALRHAHAADIGAHPLRREIIATALTNKMINIAGADLPSRLTMDWSIGTDGMASAILASLGVLEAERLFNEIGTLDGRMPGARQLSLYAEVRGAVRAHAEWLAGHLRLTGALAETIVTQRAAVGAISQRLAEVLPPRRLEAHRARVAAWRGDDAPEALAEDLARLHTLREIGDLSLLADPRDTDALAAATRTYMTLGDELRFTDLRDAARTIETGDRYDRLAVNSALAMLSASHRSVTREALSAGSIASWKACCADAVAHLDARLGDLLGGAPLSIARVTVAAAALREMAEQAVASPRRDQLNPA